MVARLKKSPNKFFVFKTVQVLNHLQAKKYKQHIE